MRDGIRGRRTSVWKGWRILAAIRRSVNMVQICVNSKAEGLPNSDVVTRLSSVRVAYVRHELVGVGFRTRVALLFV